MVRPSSATGMLKEDEAVPRRHERREIFVGATHGSPFIRRRHAERGRGMPRPYEEERTPDALILRVGFSGR
jgi:hypothetical protein